MLSSVDDSGSFSQGTNLSPDAIEEARKIEAEQS
jgi:hypothetical protein